MNMKPFSLDEYLKNPSRKLITRDGRKVTRIVCTDARGHFPIVALVESYDGTADISVQYTKDGGHLSDCRESMCDLFFVTEKHEGWINIFKDAGDNDYVGQSFIFGSKEEAEKEGKKWIDCMRTIKIEWEE